MYCYRLYIHSVYESRDLINTPHILGSSLLSMDQNRQLSALLPNRNFRLCYSSALHGSSFHTRCDNKGPTVTVVRNAATGRIFGGVAYTSWGGPTKDESAFLYRFAGDVLERTDGRVYYSDYALYNYDTCPNFGVWGEFGE